MIGRFRRDWGRYNGSNEFSRGSSPSHGAGRVQERIVAGRETGAKNEIEMERNRNRLDWTKRGLLDLDVRLLVLAENVPREMGMELQWSQTPHAPALALDGCLT